MQWDRRAWRLRGFRAASELRSKASSRLRVACSCERRLHARHRIGGVRGEHLARARPIDQGAVLDKDNISGPLDDVPLTFDGGPRRRSSVSSSPAAMARLESTPARPIVSRSCPAAGQSAASTMECARIRKDAQASPGPQAAKLTTHFRRARNRLLAVHMRRRGTRVSRVVCQSAPKCSRLRTRAPDCGGPTWCGRWLPLPLARL